jgi:undecaprenyl-diphosphatase
VIDLQYIALGFVQGITEFLPISSSGHLVLITKLSNWDDQSLFTDIAVHGGTLIAVLVYLRREIIMILYNFFQKKLFNDVVMFKIIFATFPAVIAGFFVFNFFDDYFRNLKVIACASIIFGFLLYFADKKNTSKHKWNEINFKDAVIVGIFQILAFIPGASRAGVTITGARFLGYDRKNAAIFSMLLSIPIILASLTLSIFDVINDPINNTNVLQSLFASIVACITALLSIHFMMKLIQQTNFNLFIIYRIILGFILLFFYA